MSSPDSSAPLALALGVPEPEPEPEPDWVPDGEVLLVEVFAGVAINIVRDTTRKEWMEKERTARLFYFESSAIRVYISVVGRVHKGHCIVRSRTKGHIRNREALHASMSTRWYRRGGHYLPRGIHQRIQQWGTRHSTWTRSSQ